MSSMSFCPDRDELTICTRDDSTIGRNRGGAQPRIFEQALEKPRRNACVVISADHPDTAIPEQHSRTCQAVIYSTLVLVRVRRRR
jgi:hypothetical protein